MSVGWVNLWAVLAAGVAGWLIGAAWYMAFAKPWMAAHGWANEAEMLGGEGKKPSPLPFAIALVALLVMAFTLAGLVGHLGPVSFRSGVITGALAWLGFVATTTTVNYAFSARRPMLTLIDGGHWLAVLIAQGAIIGAMGAG